MWARNIGKNMSLILDGKDIIELKQTCVGPCLVIGAGPSLDSKQLELIRDGWPDHVIVSDKMLDKVTRMGIKPEFVLTLDASPIVKTFYDNTSYEGKYMFGTHTDPELVRSVPADKIYWFTATYDDITAPRSLTAFLAYMCNDKTAAPALGNVGALAWSYSIFLGHTRIVLVGIDMSDGFMPKEKTSYWPHLKDRKDAYWYVDNPFGNKVLTNVVWDSYKETWLAVHDKMANQRPTRTINCSELTTLFGHGIECMPLEEVIENVKVGRL